MKPTLSLYLLHTDSSYLTDKCFNIHVWLDQTQPHLSILSHTCTHCTHTHRLSLCRSCNRMKECKMNKHFSCINTVRSVKASVCVYIAKGGSKGQVQSDISECFQFSSYHTVAAFFSLYVAIIFFISAIAFPGFRPCTTKHTLSYYIKWYISELCKTFL